MTVKSKFTKKKGKITDLISELEPKFDYEGSTFNDFIKKKLCKTLDKHLFNLATTAEINLIRSEVLEDINTWCHAHNYMGARFTPELKPADKSKNYTGLIIDLNTHYLILCPENFEACEILTSYYIDELSETANKFSKRQEKLVKLIDELDLLSKKCYNSLIADGIKDIVLKLRKLV